MILQDFKISPNKLAVNNQPFDSALLHLSPLYKKSRQLFLKQGGTFKPTYISESRSLSSDSLLENFIEFNPIEDELLWEASNKNKDSDQQIWKKKQFIVNLFHEQNHRILWNLLPKTRHNQDQYFKLLNFAESLVIATDIALAHQLDKKICYFFYISRMTYQTGRGRNFLSLGRKTYRQYLNALTYSIYLFMMYCKQSDAIKVIEDLYPEFSHEQCEEIVLRAYMLNKGFRNSTNTYWQKQHGNKFKKILQNKKRKLVDFTNDPLNYSDIYNISNDWFKLLNY